MNKEKTENFWHYEAEGAIDYQCKKCKSDSWWCEGYWYCSRCDLKWDGYFTDKNRVLGNRVCGVYCCKPAIIRKAKKNGTWV